MVVLMPLTEGTEYGQRTVLRRKLVKNPQGNSVSQVVSSSHGTKDLLIQGGRLRSLVALFPSLGWGQ